MLLTNMLMHIPCLRWLYLWRRRHQDRAVAFMVENPTHKQRQQQCLWCWKEEHPHATYPADLTSSMCAMHSSRQRAALSASRAARRQGVAA